MRKMYENFHIFHFQKRIVSAETICGNTVYYSQLILSLTLPFSKAYDDWGKPGPGTRSKDGPNKAGSEDCWTQRGFGCRIEKSQAAMGGKTTGKYYLRQSPFSANFRFFLPEI